MSTISCPQLSVPDSSRAQHIRSGLVSSPEFQGKNILIAPPTKNVGKNRVLVSRQANECLGRDNCGGCGRLVTFTGGLVALTFDMGTEESLSYDPENPLGAVCRPEDGEGYVPVFFKK